MTLINVKAAHLPGLPEPSCAELKPNTVCSDSQLPVLMTFMALTVPEPPEPPEPSSCERPNLRAASSVFISEQQKSGRRVDMSPFVFQTDPSASCCCNYLVFLQGLIKFIWCSFLVNSVVSAAVRLWKACATAPAFV